MTHIILPNMACLALHFVPTLSQKRHDFRKKKLVFEQRLRVLIFSTKLGQNISHFNKNLARYYHKYTCIFTQSLLYSSEVLMNLEFSPRFSKKAQISTCMKINLEAAELHAAWKTGRRTDRQTEITKLLVALRNFANALKNSSHKTQKLSYVSITKITLLSLFT